VGGAGRDPRSKSDQQSRPVPSESTGRPGRPAGVTSKRTPSERAREQAYVPAEQPSSAQGARVPAADAHPCRACCPVLSPPQGPQEPGRLSSARRLRPVLPAAHRLTRGADLRRVARSGRRSGQRTVVVHLLADDHPGPALVGFVVGRAVGGSVVRHRVQRRLRHLCRDRLALLPPGSSLVVRALPPAAAAPSSELAADLDRCLERSLAQPAGSRGAVSGA
jgi:ribonuclease P protein component